MTIIWTTDTTGRSVRRVIENLIPSVAVTSTWTGESIGLQSRARPVTPPSARGVQHVDTWMQKTTIRNFAFRASLASKIKTS